MAEQQNESWLEEELGRRIKLMETDPKTAGFLDLPVEASLEGAGDLFFELGARLLRRVHRELYNVLCGSNPEDERDRNKLRGAFGLSEEAIITSFMTVMISSLGIAPVLAPILAALLVRRFLKPIYEETCVFWGDQFDLVEM